MNNHDYKGGIAMLFPKAVCIICHEWITPRLGWNALFEEYKEECICNNCLNQLPTITGETCIICHRPFASLDSRYRYDDICFDCYRWEQDHEWSGLLQQNQSLYVYNAFLKEVIARFKFRGDYLLARAFAKQIREKLAPERAKSQRKIENPSSNQLFVPIPLSNERLYERGFNQAEALLVAAKLEPTYVLQRIHTEKQSKKSRTERIHIPQVFELTDPNVVKDKKIVLIDDIYTTGSTLRHAAKLLKTAGASSIHSFTLARG